MSQTRSWGMRMSAVVPWLNKSPEALLGSFINTSGKQGSPMTVGASLLSPSLFLEYKQKELDTGECQHTQIYC